MPPPTEQYRDALDTLLTSRGVDATSAFASIDEPVEKVHYLDTGPVETGAPPIVCLHGAGTPGSDWIPLLPALEGRRVIVVERPGHGLTPPLDYRDTEFRTANRSLLVSVLDALDIDAVAIVGNSFGGYHGLSLAASVPERVDRLVLAGAPAGIDQHPPLITRLFGVPGIAPLWYRLSLPRDRSAARSTYRRINLHDDAAVPDACFDAYLAATRLPGRRQTLLTQFRQIVGCRGFTDSFLIDDELSSITVPTRLVWGTDDYFGAQRMGQQLARKMPDATFVGVSKAGHMPWLEPGPTGQNAIIEGL